MAATLQSTLPPGLPVPEDDGACAHLTGMALPPVILMATSGRPQRMDALTGTTVLYLYPKSGPDESGLPDNWDAIPGARGCTPQACAFRDHAAELARLGASVFGVATQSPAYLAGEVARIHLPFELLSDEGLLLQRALQLPLFDLALVGQPLYKRVTLIVREARIVQVFYPVFPPDRAADQVLDWLRRHPASARR